MISDLDTTLLNVRHSAYPSALRRLPQPPPLLYALGRLELLGQPGIAVVGSRAHTDYGRDATVSLTVGLVRAGYVILSGLARGIDSIAHRTTLELGGPTVAVLGTGLDVAYPREHEGLAREIAVRGCLLSEFPPGTPPLKHHFPQRNRIIAGLACAVLVVEAAERSGALITAEHALEAGKEVFAVPGPIHSPTSRGPNRLIQDGAALVSSAADILAVMSSRGDEPTPPRLTDLDEDSQASLPLAESGSDELGRRIWTALSPGAVELDRLASLVGAGPEALSAALLELELAGLVRRLPGPRFARAPANKRTAREPAS